MSVCMSTNKKTLSRGFLIFNLYPQFSPQEEKSIIIEYNIQL